MEKIGKWDLHLVAELLMKSYTVKQVKSIASKLRSWLEPIIKSGNNLEPPWYNFIRSEILDVALQAHWLLSSPSKARIDAALHLLQGFNDKEVKIAKSWLMYNQRRRLERQPVLERH